MADENSQDIYPLGQGGGLLTDAVNFVLNNVYQYGNRLGDQSQQLGSTMERMAAGDKSAHLPPTSSLQPGLAPNVVGQITPSNWANYAPEAKAILTETFNKFPDLFRRVQKTPSNLHVSVTPSARIADRNASGVMRSVNPYFDEIQLAKNEPIPGYVPTESPGTINWKTSPPDNMRPDLQTAVHELQHHVNQPRLMQKSAADAADQATIGMLLKDFMYNKDIGSLQNRANQYAKANADPNVWRMELKSPHSREGFDFGRTPWNQFLGGAMADEGLAYLANNAINDPKLAVLAERLGVNPMSGLTTDAAQAIRNPAAGKSSLMDEIWSSINEMRNKTFGKPGDVSKESAAGGKVLSGLYKDTIDTAHRLGVKDPINQDSFMTGLMRNIVGATQAAPSTPVSMMRRFLAPSENRFNMATRPLDSQSTIDLLQHMRENGLLRAENLNRATQGRVGQPADLSMLPAPMTASQDVLDRITRLLDRLEGRRQ